MNQAEKYYLELEKESKLAGDTYNLGRAYGRGYRPPGNSHDPLQPLPGLPCSQGICPACIETDRRECYPAHIAGSLNILSNIYFYEKDYPHCRQSAWEAIRIDTTDANVTSNLHLNRSIFLR